MVREYVLNDDQGLRSFYSLNPWLFSLTPPAWQKVATQPNVALLLPRLDPEHRPVLFIREHIQQTVRPLPHIADPLTQIDEKGFTP